MQKLRQTFILAMIFSMTIVLLKAPQVTGQTNRPTWKDRMARRSQQIENRELASPFKGITTNGNLIEGLFPIRSTGVSTEPMRQSTLAFLNTLSVQQRKKTRFPIHDSEWRKWMNQHFYVRQGIGFDEMSPKQREAAFAMMGSALSAKGMKLSQDIMKLNHTLGEIKNNFTEYGRWLYWITVMGEPSPDQPWGWQLDGHHLIVNCFVLGDQVVMTPLFLGSEPVIANAGQFKGTAVLQEQQDLGLAMIHTLDKKQQKQAIIQVTKSGNNNLTEAYKDNVVLDYAGIKATDLSPSQRRQLLGLIASYIDHMHPDRAKVRMDEIKQHLSNTYFAWIGKTSKESVFYYRIHSPVLLIEFDHQRPAGMRHLFPDGKPNRQHIHTVVRTPNGNDYGKDLLRQHHLEHDHTHEHP